MAFPISNINVQSVSNQVPVARATPSNQSTVDSVGNTEPRDTVKISSKEVEQNNSLSDLFNGLEDNFGTASELAPETSPRPEARPAASELAPATSLRPEARPPGLAASELAPATSLRPEARPPGLAASDLAPRTSPRPVARPGARPTGKPATSTKPTPQTKPTSSNKPGSNQKPSSNKPSAESSGNKK